MNRLYHSILLSQNEDGGFCETKKYPKNLIQLFSCFKIFANDYNPISLVYRYREILKYKNDKKHYNINHWIKEPYGLDQSDLWNTWFRILTLAQIEKTYLKNVKWKFHNFIGLGYF